MINIIPVNDLEEHEESSTCKCGPKVLHENGNMIFVHNSFDGREAVIFGQSAELTFVTDRGKEILTKEFIEKLKQEYIELETDN